MLYPSDAFVDYLRSHQGKRVYLKPYVGNSGDTLIWLGNRLLLKQLGLIQVVDPLKADLILWPGGNPTMWATNLDGWQECWQLWPTKTFVIAPATFEGRVFDWQGLFRSAPKNVAAVFARDSESYRNLASAGLPSHIQTGTGHDPAFHLRDSEWILQHRQAGTAEYVLAGFRDDHESAFKSLPGNRLFRTWPISSVLFRLEFPRRRRFHRRRLEVVKRMAGPDKRVLDRDASLMSFPSFVECVRRAEQVHTDRLHCMILAVLLGKQVFAYPTAYNKLETVYEHSIKSWARVQFVQEFNQGR
jgi:exopolysaccharide biosynthesis predicted pyruvyltransferase EpsI